MPDDPGKRCGACGEVKPLTEFYRAAGKRDGLQNRCRECEGETCGIAHR
jgi:hypothetical protein